MHIAVISLFAFLASFWIFIGFYVVGGSLRMPWVKNYEPAPDAECPRISVIFAARDEEEKLPAALTSLAAVDYPNLEIIAVDDRSTDATARILDDFAARHPRLRVVHVAELPAGWLGKTHALQRGYELSTGEWLVFTDADVRFNPEVSGWFLPTPTCVSTRKCCGAR
jgi:cellulose synthase/poly-beta-1,6-N-acetylglucosamine synthase-like glycosyltransferase